MLDILNSFQGHPFLARLAPRDRMVLAAGAQPFHFRDGDNLAVEGTTADALFLIQSGEVSIQTKGSGQGDLDVQTVGPGQVIGWSWFIEPHVWKFTCRAKGDVRGIKFDAYWLRHLCEHDHEIGYHVLNYLVQVLAQRLTSMRLAYRQLLKEHA